MSLLTGVALAGGWDVGPPTLVVMAWGMVVWPSRSPVAVQCALHELVPRSPDLGTRPIDAWSLRRTGRAWAWLVPVQWSEVRRTANPLPDLWAPRAPASPWHALGTPAFEPDPITRQTQTRVVTLRTRSDDARSLLADPTLEGIAFFVLSASPGATSVRCEPGAQEGVSLRDGDIVVVVTDGHRTAYEVELGAPVYEGSPLVGTTTAQVEDYRAVTA